LIKWIVAFTLSIPCAFLGFMLTMKVSVELIPLDVKADFGEALTFAVLIFLFWFAVSMWIFGRLGKDG
jgi:hypothetical protein